MIIQISEGLNFLHQAHTLHGNLRLSNVLVFPDKTFRISDVVIPVLRNPDSLSGNILDQKSTTSSFPTSSFPTSSSSFSSCYIDAFSPPEVLLEDGYSSASDIFSLGAVQIVSNSPLHIVF